MIGSLVTMTPAIRTGRACFDNRRLPRDEFVRRVRAVEALAEDEALAAVVVVASAASPGPVVHLTNLEPTAGAATVVVVPGRDPVLMAGRGGRREEPYQRDVSWVPALVQRPFGADSVRPVLADRGVAAGRLGIAGLDDQVPAADRDRFVAAMGDFEIVPVDRQLSALRRRSSVRERSVLGELAAILDAALQVGVEAYAARADAGRAALAVEEAAYGLGCRDVRLLLGHPDGSLRPFEGAGEGAGGGAGGPVFSCYAAAEFLGYWAEQAATAPWVRVPPGNDLRPVVDAACARLRPGVRPDELSRAGGAGEPEVMVRGLGNEIVDLPDASSGWDELCDGDAVSIVAVRIVGGCPLLHSRFCFVGPDGPIPPAHLVIGPASR